ncbi:MAG: hypothetical protein PHV32_17840 [Eubacteriales bacterium]|nr:hypothetical protein [Eubacteriales bacterium]
MKNIDSIINQYKIAADLHGNALKNGDKKTANKHYTALKIIYKSLQKESELQTEIFRLLLSDQSYYVNAWAAAHCLGLKILINEAIKVLEELSQRKDIGITRLDAEMTLKVWKEKGTLII